MKELYRKGKYSIRYCTYLKPVDYRDIEICCTTENKGTYSICYRNKEDEAEDIGCEMINSIDNEQDLLDLKDTLKVYELMLQGERIYA
jgi:hypothetical protein